MSSLFARVIPKIKLHSQFSKQQRTIRAICTPSREESILVRRLKTDKTGLSQSTGSTPQPVWSLSEIKTPVARYNSMATLETLNFDNLALRSLPIDPEKEIFPRQVKGACFSRVKPTPVEKPHVVLVSEPALALLDLRVEESEKEDFAEYFAGNKLFPGSETAAHCYCGHQFGYFSGQLGDGAAMYVLHIF